MKINSIVFHTSRLSAIRDFYEGKLGLSVGTYVRENKTTEDCSTSYANYYLGDMLLGFEEQAGRIDIGTVIFSVPSFANYKASLENLGVPIDKSTERFFKIQDPEGRDIVIEREAETHP